jgi:hypothetical protein
MHSLSSLLIVLTLQPSVSHVDGWALLDTGMRTLAKPQSTPRRAFNEFLRVLRGLARENVRECRGTVPDFHDGS